MRSIEKATGSEGVQGNARVTILRNDRVQKATAPLKGYYYGQWPKSTVPVSYTHLDVYKRQGQNRS